MKKRIFLIGLIAIVVLNLISDFAVNALEPTPPELYVEEISTKMEVNTKFDGKYFKDGMYGYYYRIEVDNVNQGNSINPNLIHVYSKNVDICFVSKQYDIPKNSNGTLSIQLTRRPPVSAFVAFNNAGSTKGYEYTLLSCLGYTTDTYSIERMAANKFEYLVNGWNLYSSEMKEDTSTITYKVDPTKNHAHLVLVGDVYSCQVILKQYQKLWFGDNLLWEATVRLFVFSNLRIRCDSFN